MSARDFMLLGLDSVAGIASFGLWWVRCLPMPHSAACSSVCSIHLLSFVQELCLRSLGPSTPVDEDYVEERLTAFCAP